MREAAAREVERARRAQAEAASLREAAAAEATRAAAETRESWAAERAGLLQLNSTLTEANERLSAAGREQDERLGLMLRKAREEDVEGRADEARRNLALVEEEVGQALRHEEQMRAKLRQIHSRAQAELERSAEGLSSLQEGQQRQMRVEHAQVRVWRRLEPDPATCPRWASGLRLHSLVACATALRSYHAPKQSPVHRIAATPISRIPVAQLAELHAQAGSALRSLSDQHEAMRREVAAHRETQQQLVEMRRALQRERTLHASSPAGSSAAGGWVVQAGA